MVVNMLRLVVRSMCVRKSIPIYVYYIYTCLPNIIIIIIIHTYYIYYTDVCVYNNGRRSVEKSVLKKVPINFFDVGQKVRKFEL